MKKLIYKPKGEKYGFALFSAKFGERWDDIKEKDHLFIYASDFEYLIEAVKHVYPLVDSETKEQLTYFDACGMNCIYSQAWDQILAELKANSYKNELKVFIDNFCAWIIQKLRYADEIMIWGTL